MTTVNAERINQALRHVLKEIMRAATPLTLHEKTLLVDQVLYNLVANYVPKENWENMPDVIAANLKLNLASAEEDLETRAYWLHNPADPERN